MSAFSDYLEQEIINTFLRTGNVYVALFTADPTDADATANEADYTNYARQQVVFAAPANGVTNNNAQIDFPSNGDGVATTITHVGIYDNLTVGNLLFHSPLTSSKTLQSGDVLSFAANALQVTVA